MRTTYDQITCILDKGTPSQSQKGHEGGTGFARRVYRNIKHWEGIDKI